MSDPSGSGVYPPALGRRETITGIPWRAQLVSAGYITSDVVAIAGAYFLASHIYMLPILERLRWRAPQFYEPEDLQLLGLLMAIFAVFVFAGLGLYRRGVSVLNVEEDLYLLRGFMFSGITALALSFVLRDRNLPRIGIGMALMLMVPLVIIGRRMVRKLSSWLISAGVGTQAVVIYGAGDTGRQLADRLVRNPQFGLTPVGFIDDSTTTEDNRVYFGPGRKRSLEFLGTGDRLIYTLRSMGVNMLMLAMPRISSERLASIQEKCRDENIFCYYVPLFSAGPFRRFSITFMGDMPLVCERAPSSGLMTRLAKRLFDITVASLLLLLFSWLFLLMVVLIKLWSKGPAFFAQERIGQHGLSFLMHKFRSMHTEAPAYAEKPKNDKDPRIFTLGRIMRKTSIDELPQLWNVLKGEMSLVGPRPEMPQVAEGYDAVQRERFMVLPGMTGLWQVSADRNLPIHENTDYDLYYIYNQSFLLDMVILARTFFAIFSGH